jgi:UDP-N-acetylmuramoyl-L-alanyl-D-glutamate--2,6-diaminopimelate ligase
MQLQKLMATNKGLRKNGSAAMKGGATRNASIPLDITGITADSRNVEQGFLFIAIPGTQQDGRAFIADALKRGATALLIPDDTDTTSIPAEISVFTAKNMRVALSAVAANFYPRQPETIAAITGTSGKTSTAQFTMELWRALGHKSASIGTLGLVTVESTEYGSRTTPDPISLHKSLDKLAKEDISHVAIEATSHGIVLNRLDFVKIKLAAFTNLSRDHLDYHKTMEEYLAAKLKLFTELLPESSPVVLNADIPEYAMLVQKCGERHHKIISYGERGKEIRLLSFTPQAKGQNLHLEVMGKEYKVTLPLIGSFQVWNSLCALGLAIGSGAEPDKAIAELEKLSGVPGRLQLIGHTKTGGTVFVDYAHKPAALENVLNGLRPHAQGNAKLIVVFGCGGNRDTGKRPLMGGLATSLADWAIVTDDNPRYEKPDLIRQEILAGCAGASNVREIGDRAEAIRIGIEQLKKGDVLVIAGKGHEIGQIVGDKVLPFDDAALAREIMGIKA